MDNRLDAVYGRQSVDKKDSISIESQIEFCKYELKGENFREYTDKGYSGKNTDRPQFQQLIRDIEKGLIKRVVVYKLDRISRSIIDFANMMELFQKYNVEFVSSTEKFDTSTPMGRAMLNICIVFAQLERETIQKRVTDAYYSRCKKGFKMGGKPPFGYDSEPFVLDGIRTKRFVPKPDEQEIVKLMFEMYAKPEASIGDLCRYFTERGIVIYRKGVTRSALSRLIQNPVYVQADMDIYDFFKGQGTVIENDAEDFVGLNGCYLYQGRDVAEKKTVSLKGQSLVVAPHDGLIPSDIWLRCRRKLMANRAYDQTGRKAKNTWLSGKLKCGKCGGGIVCSKSKEYIYLRCHNRMDSKGCEGCGLIRCAEMEQFILNAMLHKMQEFQTLNGGEAKANPKLTALKVELAQVESEIEKLVESLTGANAVLISYANNKIEALDNERQCLAKSIADLTIDTVAPEQMIRISGYLDDWDNVDFDDKRQVVDAMISVIRATSESVKIEWKI